MGKLLFYLATTMIGLAHEIVWAHDHCTVYFFPHQIDLTFQRLSERRYQITYFQTGNKTTCKKIAPSKIPPTFRPEVNKPIQLALYCRMGMFPSYYLFYPNRAGVYAIPHLVNGGAIFSPLRCH